MTKSTKRTPAHALLLSPRRRRVFTLITILSPALLVALLEVGLRLGGYGPDLSLFVTETIAGHPHFIMNPDVKSRYFAKVDFTPNTSYDAFTMPKASGVYRIFCLGGSTTVGYPYGYCGSFSSYLRDRLTALFPGRPVEVINLGMTATNSFTVLDIARELAAYQPDLLIVYDGHNEFYGALGSASRESVGRSRWLTLLYLRLVHARVFLLARDLYGRLTGPPTPGQGALNSGTMMERLAYGQYVPYGGETYTAGLALFRSNLADLAAFCSERGIPLILSTQVSNLRHQPPFVPGPPAAGGDSVFADGWYSRARAADSAHAYAEARRAYIQARDLDQLRFRASSDFNDAIKMFHGTPGVTVVDIEHAFAAASPDSIVGKELILEHLHPNSHGYFLMAKEYAAAMRAEGLLAQREEWKQRDTIGDAEILGRSTLTPVDELAARKRTELLTSGWPFTPPTLSAPHPRQDDPVAVIAEQLVRGRITWEQAHVAAARHYGSVADTASMVREYRALINQLPQNVSAYIILGQFYLRSNRLQEAERVLTASLAVEPGFFAYRSLGGLALQRGRADSAIFPLQKGLLFASDMQERSETGYLLAVAYQRAGRVQEARSTLQQVLTSNPSFRPARTLLNRLGEGVQ